MSASRRFENGRAQRRHSSASLRTHGSGRVAKVAHGAPQRERNVSSSSRMTRCDWPRCGRVLLRTSRSCGFDQPTMVMDMEASVASCPREVNDCFRIWFVFWARSGREQRAKISCTAYGVRLSYTSYLTATNAIPQRVRIFELLSQLPLTTRIRARGTPLSRRDRPKVKAPDRDWFLVYIFVVCCCMYTTPAGGRREVVFAWSKATC